MKFLLGYLQSPCYRQSLSKTSTPKMHRFFVKKRDFMIQIFNNSAECRFCSARSTKFPKSLTVCSVSSTHSQLTTTFGFY